MKTNWLARMGAGAVVVLIAMPVFAGSDTKWYPGAMCQMNATAMAFGFTVNGDSYGFAYNPFGPSWTGATYNQSTSVDASTICPIVRDQNVSSIAWTSLKVTALNYSTSTPLCCNARTSNPDDYQYDYKQVCVPKNTGNAGWTTLQFPSAVAPANGYLFLDCTVPKKSGSYPSGIASYEVTEPSP